MTDSNLIELAKLGDPQSIAALMNQSLESRGMRATVDRQGDCLEVMLEAERIPNRQSLTAFVQKGINNLGIQTITSIRILGQQFGASYPAWMQELRLDGFPDPEIGTTPLPIQSETAIDSPPIPNEPVTPSGSADFSVTGSMNLDTVMDAKPSSDSADLNELWNPSEEPDFLHELLATESVPADLSNQSVLDEATTTDADGLMDFLNDLSGETAQEEFPAEVVQEQSSFMAGIEGSESANFQDLFVESGEPTDGLSDNGLSDEMGNLAWEDSGETTAGGEPDADLLNFLNTPDESLVPSAEFTPPDEQILADYPDALSIDQLPEDLLSEANAPEAPLEEPPEDFLSTLLGEPIDPPISDAMLNAMPDADEAISEPLINPPDQEPIAEPLTDPILQDPWAIDPVVESVAEPEPMAQPEFPEETATESTPLSAASGPEESDLEEALPDFLVEPMLDLPAADPAEMTLSTLEQQPEVLDAAVEETIDESIQSPPDQPYALASLFADDDQSDDQAKDASDSFSLVEESSTDMTLESDHEEVAASVERSPEEIEPEEIEPEVASLETPSQSFPDATLLSNFADSQTETTFWEDSEEEVEEIPPDFLLEMESWETVEPESSTPDAIVDFPLDFPVDSAAFPTESEQPIPTLADETPEFEELTSPDPEWSALEAQLSSLDLASDPQAAAPEIDTDLALDLESPDPDFSIDPLGMEAIEPLSNTPEGTAIEPPADWVAAASPVDAWAEPVAEFSPSEFSPSTEIEAMNAEFSDSVPEEASANGSASELNPSESDPREDAGEPDADPPTPLPDLSQDELEAGLGDFRAGFVEPLPPEFFEADEPQPGYSDWQANLREPLSLDDEEDEAGYIIEDSTPDVEYTPPPLPADPDVRSSSTSSPSGIFVMVLFALCAFLGMLGGYILFKSRLTPQPSNVPPPAEPPAEPAVPTSPAPASPVPASPTSANPVDPIANQAIDRAFAAVLMGPIAQSDADWQRINHEWQQAIVLAQASDWDTVS